MLLGRPLAGTKIALVVEIHAIGDGIETMFAAVALHDGEELVFAVEAALCVIAGIIWIFQLLRLDDLAGNVLFLREKQGVFKLSSRQRGRIGDERQHVLAQRLMRGMRQISGVHASGVRDEHPAKRAKMAPQSFVFDLKRHATTFYPSFMGHDLATAGFASAATACRK